MSRSAENRMIQASWSRKASALQHAPLDPAVLMCAEVPRGAIPLNTKSDRFNINPMVVQNILESSYTKTLVEATYQDLIDAIYEHADHVEPWSAGTARTPSTAWCVLYRMLCMRLTRNQMKAMLNHADSVYIRAVGFLYLRLATDAGELWDWFAPYLDDPQEITPGADPSTRTTLGRYLRMLLTEIKYFNIMLPRIPTKIAREIEVKVMLLDQAAERAVANMRVAHRFKKGAKVRALFSEDDTWYEATLGDEVAEGVFMVTYDEYGNSEQRSLGYIELKDGGTDARLAGGRGRERSRSRGGGRGSSRDRGGGESGGGGAGGFEDLQRQVLARERNKALASGKDYAQRPASYKGSLSLKMDRYTARNRSRSRSPVKRRSSERSPGRDRRDDRDRRDRSRDRAGRDRDRRSSRDRDRRSSRDRDRRSSRDRDRRSSRDRDRRSSRDRDRRSSRDRSRDHRSSRDRDGDRDRHHRSRDRRH